METLLLGLFSTFLHEAIRIMIKSLLDEEVFQGCKHETALGSAVAWGCLANAGVSLRDPLPSPLFPSMQQLKVKMQ